jgi:hypothetical protein
MPALRSPIRLNDPKMFIQLQKGFFDEFIADYRNYNG